MIKKIRTITTKLAVKDYTARCSKKEMRIYCNSVNLVKNHIFIHPPNQISESLMEH